MLTQLGYQGLPSIPQVLAYGHLVDQGLCFSILSGLHGKQLKNHFRSGFTAIRPLQEAMLWLDCLNAVKTGVLAAILPQGLTARFLPSFDPLSEGLATCDKLENSFDVHFARNFLHFAAEFETSNPEPCIIHGSFTVFNILANSNSLCGIVDFESTRIGDPMEDYGSLGYYLAQEVSEKSAFDWLQLTMHRYGRHKFVTRAVPFMLWFALARTNLQKVRWGRIRKIITKLEFFHKACA